ncbi:hypothetical protein [Mycobacterium kyorinense]|uniref:Uncharacterized protein n=1 Tax=Mycobacterium kyorinense TaxID=487514 RepID=A0A1X1XDN7_9MYCO|nr:hypothetical protein [Mycobacterium kyorinense]ORV96800.1 hypothetical protein AWC14_16420 [Mycobacterium kyorinense]
MAAGPTAASDRQAGAAVEAPRARAVGAAVAHPAPAAEVPARRGQVDAEAAARGADAVRPELALVAQRAASPRAEAQGARRAAGTAAAVAAVARRRWSANRAGEAPERT